MHDSFWRVQCGNWSRLFVAPSQSSPVELATQTLELLKEAAREASAISGFRINGQNAEMGKYFDICRDYSPEFSWEFPSPLIFANAGYFPQSPCSPTDTKMT
jgi:hypothetical protein